MKKILFLAALFVSAITNIQAQSLNFDGSNDYVSVPDNASLNFGTNDFTIEAYYKSAVSQSNYAGIVAKTNCDANPSVGFQLVLVNNNIAAEFTDGTTFLGTADGLQGTSNVSDGNWHYLAMIVNRSSNTIQLLVDGTVEATVTNSNISTMNITNTLASMFIGSERCNIAFINGTIDEVHLWNTARTTAQVQNDMSCTFAAVQTGLVANYNFNEGTANGTNTITSLTDISGNNNNGTLNNFALTGTSSNWVEGIGSVSFSGTNNVCSGTATILTASSSATTTYAWSANAASATTASVSVNPSTTTIYTVTATTGVCITTDTVRVSVTSTPTISISGNTNICSGISNTLTASGASTYTWSANAGGATTASISGALNSTKTFSVTGANGACTAAAAITVSVTTTPTVNITSVPNICQGDNNTLSAIGASAYLWSANAGSATTATATPTTNSTDTYTVIGNNGLCADTVTVTVNVNSQPTVTVASETICAGTTTTLTANSSTAISYLWNTGETTSSIFSGSTSNTDYTVTVKDANGCMGATTATVSINATPNISVNSPVICVGDVATLTANGTATTFTWSTTQTGVTITPSPTITTNYTVTGADANGCENTATTIITVNNLPTVTVNSATACAGSPATLSATGASTYTWSTTALGALITPSATTTTNYTVTGSDGNGCENSAIATVTVIALPTITISGNSASSICAGTPSTLNASGANTYSWSTTALTASVTVTPTTTTNYTVTGTDNVTTCTNTAVVTITVTPLPDNAVVSSSNVLTANNAVAIYQWIDCGTHTVINAETNQNFTPTVTGSYQVKLTENGCTDTSTCYAVTVTGINSFTDNLRINMYPNPATDAFYIQTNITFDNATIEVYDMIGQKVLTEKIQSNLTRLSLDNLNNAVYQVRVISNNVLIYQSKIIKQQ